ncbi:zinc-dependent metalloprotease family protein [Mumia qirimensis]|uniref:zinc-dependent metalloprotease family protein n=1 Tax=Mumia qirimensis TaxID=3234852 RepID=UPI00351D058A
MSDATSWIRINRIPATDIGPTVWHSTAQTNADVIVFDRYYDDYCGLAWDSGVLGLATCRSITATNRCDQANVRYNNTFTSNWTATYHRSLACHEVGHAIGLKHREDQCMETVGLTRTGYSAHDVAHINAEF